MPLKSSFSVPKWNERRWKLFKTFISKPSVTEVIERYQKECLPNELGTYPMWVWWGVNEEYLPDGCERAYEALLNTPGITDQELVNLITPPVQIISHADKYLGPNKDPHNTYERYMYKIGGDNYPEDADPLFYDDPTLYLRVDPFTNPTEIKAFVTNYYEKEMWPYLQKDREWKNQESKYLTDRKAKLRQAVVKNVSLQQRVASLKSEGMKNSDIVTAVHKEFGEYLTPTKLRKLIQQANKDK